MKSTNFNFIQTDRAMYALDELSGLGYYGYSDFLIHCKVKENYILLSVDGYINPGAYWVAKLEQITLILVVKDERS